MGAEKQEDQLGGRKMAWRRQRPAAGWCLGDEDEGLVSGHPPGGLGRGDREEARMMPQFGGLGNRVGAGALD